MNRLCWVLNFCILCCVAGVPAAIALEPDADIHQLQHTSWTISEGAPPDVWALAQGPNGFLWLATGTGLYRFDGVTFERFQPARGQTLQSLDLNSLAFSQSGEMWIGYQSAGISRIANGQLENFTEKDGIPVGHIWSIAIDRSSDVWIASEHGLFRYHLRHWDKIGRSWGYPYDRADFLLIARDGTLWVTGQALLSLKPGSKKFQTVIRTVGQASMPVEDNTGRVWITDPASGIYPVDDAEKSLAFIKMHASEAIRAGKIRFDRDGMLWATDEKGGGVFRVRSPSTAHHPLLQSDVTDTFRQADGLTNNIVVPILDDREGNIWIGSALGLDRFRANRFISVSGIPTNTGLGYSFALDGSGDILALAANSLFRIKNQRSLRLISASLPIFGSILTDRKGRVWIAGIDSDNKRYFGQLVNDRLLRIPLPEKMIKSSNTTLMDSASSVLAEDANGGILVGIGANNLLSFKDEKWYAYGEIHQLPKLPYTVALTDSEGRTWIGFHSNSLALIDHGVSHIFTTKNGPSIGFVTAIADVDGKVLFGGEFGLAEYSGKGFKSITTQQFSGFSGITGIVQSRDGDIWTNGTLGIVRAAKRELQLAFDNTHYKFRYELFDFRDGVTAPAKQAARQQTALARADGTLWFETDQRLVTTAPAYPALNRLPPPVSILSIAADGQVRQADGNQILPAAVKDLRFDYTALSLSIPERVQFRYKLEGYSDRWIDPGQSRQAYFTNLPPGQYRFRVIASNNDGVWNTTGASASFQIPPTFIQTKTFFALCVMGAVLTLWAAYTARVKQMADQVRSRLEERIRERERIARELHDTLLQSVQGLTLRFHAIARKMRTDDPRRREVELAVERADEVLAEGRDRVRCLRNPDNQGDLLASLQRLGTELAASGSTRFHLITEGRSRELHAMVHEELTCIGREAVLNAFAHAKAQEIVTEVSYRRSELRLQVRDDGTGLPDDVAQRGTRDGHFGLIGIRERAKRIRSKVALRSKMGAGTELTVIVPAAVAYTNKTRFGESWKLRRFFQANVEVE